MDCKERFDMEENGMKKYSSNEVLTTDKRYLSTNKRRIAGIAVAIFVVALIALAIGLGTHYGNEASKTDSNAGKQSGGGIDDKNTKSVNGINDTFLKTGSSYGTPTIPSTDRPLTTTSYVVSTSQTSMQNTNTTTATTTLPTVDWLQESCDLTASSECPGSSIPLLLISMDGFRADYLQRNITPVLQKLSQCGVHSSYIRSIFPTMTFPNHYTIVTGLYAESHGIVGNTMYDEEIGEKFTLRSSTKMDPAWWSGEPIWITAKKQGKKSASYFWVGSDVNISGIYPDEWHLYDGRVTYEARIERVLEWVSSPLQERPDMMLTYFDEPDHEGHGSGPDDIEVDTMIKKMDDYIGQLMNGLARKGLHKCLNIILVADHGMTETSCGREIDYSKFINTNRFITQGGTYGHINTRFMTNFTKYSDPQSVDSIVNELECKSDRMRVFTKETSPKRHHVLNSNRIGDILLKVDDRWLLKDGKGSVCFLKGNHGYDNIFKSMEALFLAYGPAFKQNFEAQPFENIELYNLMCNVLGVEAAPNNGTEGSLYHILQNPPPAPKESVNRGQNCVPANRVQEPSCGCPNVTSPGIGQGVASSDQPPKQHPVSVSNTNTCALSNPDFDVLYSTAYNLPVWVSYTITGPQKPANVSEQITAARGCVLDDTRVNVSTSSVFCQLQSTNFKPGYLFEPYFSSSNSSKEQSYQTTNVMPMYEDFQKGIWSRVQQLVIDYSTLYGSVSVVSGPIWDRDGDGLADNLNNNNTQYVGGLVPVPTHYYIVIMRCSNGTELTCDQGSLDIVSFILPHVEKIPNCLLSLRYLQDNVARVRDIELLTELQFFTELDINTAAQLRTFLPVTIWPTTIVDKRVSWLDESCTVQTNPQCPAGSPPLILIGLDGFGADLLALNATPVVERLRQCGVHSPLMRPVYPTLTFPNMYSIVTGLYPESHGIVSNNMYDRYLNKRFTISSSGTSDLRWWGGEPIWNTAMKQGKTTASFFWVGSEIKIGGLQPNITQSPYSSAYPYQARVATVLKWLDLPEDQRPDFITLYFDKPDYTIHRQGTNSPETAESLGTVDSMVGKLMDGLVARGIQDCVNIIIVADHGMLNTSCDRQVKLNDHLTNSELAQVYVYDGPDAQVATDYRYSGGKVQLNQPPESTEDYLEKLQCKDPHAHTILKSLSPVRHHYVNNARIPDILIQSQPGYLVSRKGYRYCDGGNHGWDNINVHLGSLFVGYGPSFKSSLEIETFENIELYNLMAELLDITPAPNNGTLGSLNRALRNPSVPPLPSVQDFPVCPYLSTSTRAPVLTTNCSCILAPADNTFLSSLANNTTVSSPAVMSGPKFISPDDRHICELTDPQSIRGYDTEFNYPAWIISALPTDMPPVTSIMKETDCILDDSRVPPLPGNRCQLNNMTMTPLLPEELSPNSSYSKLSTNSVMMYPGFKTGVWKELWSSVRAYNTYPPVTMSVGTVFDYNQDGLADSPEQIRNMTESTGDVIPVATHFFISLLRCEKVLPGTGCDQYGVLSFVLPHVDQIPECWNMTEYLNENVVRLRDIELLTGFRFLTEGLPNDVALKLRLRLPIVLF